MHLSGGKGDRTALVVLDYFEKQNKLFLTHVFEQIQGDAVAPADQILVQIIKENTNRQTALLALDAPMHWPKCVTCRLKCPGYERCKEPEITWFWKQHKRQRKNKPRVKLFTPYTQRVVENYLSSEVAEELPPLETLGANTAPIASRALFLLKRIKHIQAIEVFPSLSVLKIGQSLKIPKSHFLHYKHLVGGDESRQVILDHILAEDMVFIYQQDYHRLIANLDAFEALFCALTGFLKFKGECEKPPKDLPLKQGWIEYPKTF